MTTGVLYPDWPAPGSVRALVSTRCGGFSAAPYAGFNLAMHVGDQPTRVEQNRMHLLAQCEGLECIQWLEQVHGTAVIDAPAAAAMPLADGSITRRPGIGCAVLTADCLPVLLCDAAGSQVSAVHGGWRGLAAGILDKAVGCFSAAPGDLLAWMGPAISQQHFEVGDEVRLAFLRPFGDEAQAAFTASDRPGHWRADLYQLARLRLRQLGVAAVYGGNFCTFAEADRFYSYRRDGVTGRMASLIYIHA